MAPRFDSPGLTLTISMGNAEKHLQLSTNGFELRPGPAGVVSSCNVENRDKRAETEDGGGNDTRMACGHLEMPKPQFERDSRPTAAAFLGMYALDTALTRCEQVRVRSVSVQSSRQRCSRVLSAEATGVAALQCRMSETIGWHANAELTKTSTGFFEIREIFLESKTGVHKGFRKIFYGERMFKVIHGVFGAIRLVSALIAALGITRRVGGSYGVTIAPISEWLWLGQVYDFLTWTPVFALSLIIVGTWISEMFDALTYRLEGSPTLWGTVLLWSRLRFTRAVLARPAWYPNEHRVQREIARTNEALSNAGFATLGDLPITSDSDVSSAVEYLSVAGAMIWALGVVRAGSMSFGAKSLLAMPIALRPVVVISPPIDEPVPTPAPPNPPVLRHSVLAVLRRLLRRH